MEEGRRCGRGRNGVSGWRTERWPGGGSVKRQFGICAQLTFLFLASSCFAQDAPTTKAFSPELHISVQDSANVPPELLAAADAEVHRNFPQAGVETLWPTCATQAEKTHPSSPHAAGSRFFVS